MKALNLSELGRQDDRGCDRGRRQRSADDRSEGRGGEDDGGGDSEDFGETEKGEEARHPPDRMYRLSIYNAQHRLQAKLLLNDMLIVVLVSRMGKTALPAPSALPRVRSGGAWRKMSGLPLGEFEELARDVRNRRYEKRGFADLIAPAASLIERPLATTSNHSVPARAALGLRSLTRNEQAYARQRG